MDEPNYVYVIRFSDRVHKIGISRDPNKRLSQLSCQHRHPLSLVRTWLREGGDAGRVEISRAYGLGRIQVIRLLGRGDIRGNGGGGMLRG